MKQLVTIEETQYWVDVTAAIAKGVLEPVSQLKIANIPNGVIFRWWKGNKIVGIYLMLNNAAKDRTMCVSVDEPIPRSCYFLSAVAPSLDPGHLEYYDLIRREWVGPIHIA